MAFTSFRNDPSRISKEMQISSYSARYFLDTPGQGIDLPFIEDPNIRMQRWGANLRNNTVNLETIAWFAHSIACLYSDINILLQEILGYELPEKNEKSK
jgi:hypothetical protein